MAVNVLQSPSARPSHEISLPLPHPPTHDIPSLIAPSLTLNNLVGRHHAAPRVRRRRVLPVPLEGRYLTVEHYRRERAGPAQWRLITTRGGRL